MASIEVKDKSGKKVGTHEVSAAIAEANPSIGTVHRTVVAEEANKRQGTQKTKTRSEVRGGGRKPYKQKKTGNARQGSIRSPQWAHGGMAHAVMPRDYDKKVNKKERRAAILGALNEKVQKGDLSIVDAILFAEPKTKQAADFLNALGLANQRRVLVILPAYDEVTYKSFRNLPNVTVRTAPASSAGGAEAVKTSAFSTRDVMVAHKVVIAQDALAKIEEVWAK
jgi:large subunit ribosomal protein L4